MLSYKVSKTGRTLKSKLRKKPRQLVYKDEYDPLKELRHAVGEDESKRVKEEVEVIKAHGRKVKATPPKNVQRPRHATLSQSIQKDKVSKAT